MKTHAMKIACGIGVCLLALVVPPSVRAEEVAAEGPAAELDALRERVVALERELRELRIVARDTAGALARVDAAAPRPAVEPHDRGLADRVRLSGNADLLYQRGRSQAPSAEGVFALENFRLFIDIDLDGPGSSPLADSVSLYLESDLVRDGELKNKIGSAYLRLDRLFGQRWLGVKLGRMPIPFGQEYLRFSEERPRNPFLTFSASAPYQWDEGIMLFGSIRDGLLAYEIAALDGDDAMGANTDSDMAWSARIHLRPFDRVGLTLSGLHTGELGSNDEAAKSALEFGGSHAVPFGDPGGIVSYADGVPLAPDPVRTVDGLTAWQADLVLEPFESTRLWLAYGRADVDAGGASLYDRDFAFWVAETEVDLGLLAGIDHVYVAGRYSAIGTFDRDRGYQFDAENGAEELGFNTSRVDLWQAVLGYRIRPNVTLKAEYARYDHALVRGVPLALERKAKARDFFAAGVSVGF